MSTSRRPARQEAREAGRLLLEAGLTFDIAYTSVLRRAIRTLWIGLDELDRMWLPVEHSWRLNERHYGDLQGLNKAETAARFGEAQVKIWRRSYDIPPPPLALDDPRHPSRDPRYADVDPADLPRGESLKDTVARFRPYWEATIAPVVREGRRVLIAAHGNSLRALVKDLDGISDEDIVGLDIPTGIPLVYELDDDLRPLSPSLSRRPRPRRRRDGRRRRPGSCRRGRPVTDPVLPSPGHHRLPTARTIGS